MPEQEPDGRVAAHLRHRRQQRDGQGRAGEQRRHPDREGEQTLADDHGQGHEPAALDGMEETLRRNGNVRMLMEFWPYGLKEAGSSARAVADWLASRGFHFWLVSGSGKLVKYEEHLVGAGPDDFCNIFVTREKDFTP